MFPSGGMTPGAGGARYPGGNDGRYDPNGDIDYQDSVLGQMRS